jgi:flagellar FliL protein
MAEEENVVGEGSEKGAATSKRPVKKIILTVMVIALLGAGSFGAWKFFFNKNHVDKNDPAVAEAQVTEDTSPKIKIMHEMKPFIVNLLGDEGKRYLKAKIITEVGEEAVQEELANRGPEIRDAILLLLASKSFENISTPEGKSALRTELIARINRVLDTGTIRMLYFTEFVVQ